MNQLKNIKLFLLDMDGTFYLGDRVLDGSRPFVSKIESLSHCELAFLTNNSSKNKKDYIKKLSYMGFDFHDNQVVTSGEATTIYLSRQKPNAKVFLLGTKSLEQEFIDAGFILTDKDPDFVVLGFDLNLTYERLRKMCDFVRDGVPYIATHPDFNCPIENGGFIPDTGSMIAFIEASTGKRPFVIGKPNRYIIDSASEKFNIPHEQIAMVGDRLYTDIAVGANAGITSILVLSGETSMDDLKGSNVQPDYIFEDLGELAKQL